MTHIIAIAIFTILIFCIIALAKKVGEKNAVIKDKTEEQNQYEKDKEIVNNNNNLNHDELIDKLHNIQNKP